MPKKATHPLLTGTFNASVEYQLHSKPPHFGLHSKELGYTEVYLGDLNLTDAQIDVLCKSPSVEGTYELRAKAGEIYHPIKGVQKSVWTATSLKPAAKTGR